MISFGHFQTRLDYSFGRVMTDVRSLWISQFGDSFQKFWSSINKVDKENKDTGHIKDTGISMTQEDLIKTWKLSLSAAPPEFLLKLQDASSAGCWWDERVASLASSVVLLSLPGCRQSCGDFQEQWWHLHPTTRTSGSVTPSPSPLVRSPLGMMWRKRRWMLRRRKKKMMRKELWRRTTRKIQEGQWHWESSRLSMNSHQNKVSFKTLLYQFCQVFILFHISGLMTTPRRRLWHLRIGWGLRSSLERRRRLVPQPKPTWVCHSDACY